MNFLTLKKAAYSFALLSIIGTPQIVVAADVDEVASITGRIIRSWGYIVPGRKVLNIIKNNML